MQLVALSLLAAVVLAVAIDTLVRHHRDRRDRRDRRDPRDPATTTTRKIVIDPSRRP